MARRTDLMGVSGAETVIGAGVRLKGTLLSDSDIVIDGKLDGEIKAAGNVTVGVNAVIRADIKGTNVSVAGHVKGNIEASGETQITETGKVTGNITTGTLAIEAGAIFSGMTKMSQNEAESIVTESVDGPQKQDRS